MLLKFTSWNTAQLVRGGSCKKITSAHRLLTISHRDGQFVATSTEELLPTGESSALHTARDGEEECGLDVSRCTISPSLIRAEQTTAYPVTELGDAWSASPSP